MDLTCPNCHKPFQQILAFYAEKGMTDEAIACVLEWPHEVQERLYRLLHAAGMRI